MEVGPHLVALDLRPQRHLTVEPTGVALLAKVTLLLLLRLLRPLSRDGQDAAVQGDRHVLRPETRHRGFDLEGAIGAVDVKRQEAIHGSGTAVKTSEHASGQ